MSVPPVGPPGFSGPDATAGTTARADVPRVTELLAAPEDELGCEAWTDEEPGCDFTGALLCAAPGTSDSQPRCTRLGSESLAIPTSVANARTATQPVRSDRRDVHEPGTGHIRTRAVIPSRAVDLNIVYLRSKAVTTLTKFVTGVIGPPSPPANPFAEGRRRRHSDEGLVPADLP